MLTKRWSSPSSPRSWSPSGGYTPTSSVTTSRSVPGDTRTELDPPTCVRRTAGIRTTTAICLLRAVAGAHDVEADQPVVEAHGVPEVANVQMDVAHPRLRGHAGVQPVAGPQLSEEGVQVDGVPPRAQCSRGVPGHEHAVLEAEDPV